MIDTKKVQLMTRIANYEKSQGIRDLKMNRYNKKTYIALRILEAFVSINIIFVLCGCLIAAYLFLMVANNVRNSNWTRIAICFGVIYAAVLLATLVYQGFLSKKKYEKMRVNIQIYEENLRKLQAYFPNSSDGEVDGSEPDASDTAEITADVTEPDASDTAEITADVTEPDASDTAEITVETSEPETSDTAEITVDVSEANSSDADESERDRLGINPVESDDKESIEQEE